MNEFVSWCRHLLVSFLFHALTSLHPPSFYRNDFSTCIPTHDRPRGGEMGLVERWVLPIHDMWTAVAFTGVMVTDSGLSVKNTTSNHENNLRCCVSV